MAQRFRIFSSSPGDVPDERLRAELVIDKLAQDYSRYFTIESYRWEHEPMLASGHFQDAIEPPSASDDRQRCLLPFKGLSSRLPTTRLAPDLHQAIHPEDQRQAERFIQTALREWAYARAYHNSDQRSAELLHWLHRYNWHRPHGSLKANTPISRLGLSEDNLLRLHI
jgi:transposase InsO family protein